MANGGVLGGCTEKYCLHKDTAYCKKYKDGMQCTGVHTCTPPKDCVGFFDGCNSCGADNGRTTFCSMMYCMPNFTRQPYCTAFKNGSKCRGLGNCDETVVVQG